MAGRVLKLRRADICVHCSQPLDAGVQASWAADFATAEEIRRTVEEVGGIVGLLKVTQPKLRSRFYEEVGLTGTFDPTTRSVEASADLGVRKVRVGGGTSTPTTRPVFSGQYSTLS